MIFPGITLWKAKVRVNSFKVLSRLYIFKMQYCVSCSASSIHEFNRLPSIRSFAFIFFYSNCNSIHIISFISPLVLQEVTLQCLQNVNTNGRLRISGLSLRSMIPGLNLDLLVAHR
jgi:hypothetical protein